MFKKKALIFVFMFICLFSILQFASAETYKQGQTIDLKISCIHTNCSNTQNITIVAPNSSILIDNVETTLSNGFLNITFNNTNALGDYSYFLSPDYYDGTFDVTPTGYNSTTAQSLAYSFLLIFSIILMCLAWTFAFVIDGKHEWTMGGDLVQVNFNNYFKLGLFFMGYLFAIFSSFLAWQVSSNVLLIDTGSTIFSFLFNTLWVLLFPIIILILILGLIKWLADLELHKLGERGLHER